MTKYTSGISECRSCGSTVQDKRYKTCAKCLGAARQLKEEKQKSDSAAGQGADKKKSKDKAKGNTIGS
jgi:hypothetical protein